MIQEKETKKITNLFSLLSDYANYNFWANKRLIDWLKTKPEELIGKEVPSSFTSIKQTLFHIRTVQDWWLGNLTGAVPESQYRHVYQGTASEIFEDVLEQSEKLTNYVESLSQLSLHENCSFSIPTVGEFNQQKLAVIQHTMNHSTYHRGQIVTIGHHLGFHDAPMTDYMYYLLRQNFE